MALWVATMQSRPRLALHVAWLVLIGVEWLSRADTLLASAPTLPTEIGSIPSETISSSTVETDIGVEADTLGKTFWGDAASTATAANASAESTASAPEHTTTLLDEGALEMRERRVSQAIAAATAVAAIADGGLAQFPGIGDAVGPTIQAAMVAYIGHVYGCYMDFGHAMSAVTWLASKYANTLIIAKIVGYVPGIGNLIKAGVTYTMTPIIGKKAKELLSCPQSSNDLLKAASAGNSNDTGNLSNRTRRLFHTVSDYLVHPDMPSLNMQDSWANEVWNRMKRLFRTQDQVELLAEISNATEAESLARLLRSHTWNLEAVTAVLSALSERFALPQACIEVDYVAGRFWVPEAVNAEAREAAAPYVLLCLAQATATTRRAMAQTAARLLVATRGGAVAGLSLLAVRQALQVLEHTVQELSSKELAEVATAAFASLSRGEAAACGALRAILRADASAAALEHLELLDRLIVPDGAEECLPALRIDVVQQLTISALPSGIEVPEAEISSQPRQRKGSGAPSVSQRLEDKLSQTLVGQRCALERLTRDPGYVRLRLRGMWGQNRPLVLLLTGPSGTGKTLLARTLGEAILDRPIAELEADGRFRTFHMNVFTLAEDQKSFFGPPKGIVGTGDLPELLKQWPDAVVLLDEVEKAHSSFSRALLKVFGEHGAVYDPHTGRDISAVNATFVLTSNLGKDLISAHAQSLAHTATADRDEMDCAGYMKLQEDVDEALTKPRIGGHDNFFRESELRGRITDVLPFLPFSKGEVEKAVRRFLTSEAQSLAKDPEFLHASLAWTTEVVQLFASENSRRPEQGLRGVETKLQVQVRQVMERAVETKLLSHSCTAVLRVRGQRLDLQVVPNMAGAFRAWFVDKFASGPAASSSAGSADSSTASSARSGAATMGPAPAASGGAWSTDWAQDRQWVHETDWDWTLFWNQMQDFMWEHWRTALIVTVAVFAMVTIPFAPSVASAASPAAAAAASAAVAGTPGVGSAAGAAAASAAWLPSLLGVVQFMMPVVASIPSALLMAYAWQHRHWLTGIVACVMMLPAMRRALYWGCQEAESSPNRRQACSGERVTSLDRRRRRAIPGAVRRVGTGLRPRVRARLNVPAMQQPDDEHQEDSTNDAAAENMLAEETAQDLQELEELEPSPSPTRTSISRADTRN
mmetsp:Transcript_40223/g.66553  ORF Transcript_40223/g.66553 Transcript_40223/m.66553 type:complete len:1160 (-) Transcript_40223:106-3585(-)